MPTILRRLQCVRAGRELDGNARAIMAVHMNVDVVAVRSELDAGDVAHAHRRAVGGRLEHDIGELLGGLQARLGGDGGGDKLVVRRRLGTDLAGRHLVVLRLDGRDHVARHQLVGGQLVGVEPDAHGVRRAEHIGIAHAVDAADRVLDV